MNIAKIWFDNDYIFIQTNVGHIIGNPLSWFPHLQNATPAQRAAFEISPFGIHWEELDEDLSLNGFFDYKRKNEAGLNNSIKCKPTKLYNLVLTNILVMRTISIDISDFEAQKFGLKGDKLSFSDFVEIISRELNRQNLARTVELAERYGLSNMTMEEISKEVKAVRDRNAAHS